MLNKYYNEISLKTIWELSLYEYLSQSVSCMLITGFAPISTSLAIIVDMIYH